MAPSHPWWPNCLLIDMLGVGSTGSGEAVAGPVCCDTLSLPRVDRVAHLCRSCIGMFALDQQQPLQRKKKNPTDAGHKSFFF